MRPADAVGWLGVAMILTAYGLITLETLSPQDIGYILLNIFGSIGIATSSYTKRDFQPVLLNVVWLMIAAIGLIRIL